MDSVGSGWSFFQASGAWDVQEAFCVTRGSSVGKGRSKGEPRWKFWVFFQLGIELMTLQMLALTPVCVHACVCYIVDRG